MHIYLDNNSTTPVDERVAKYCHEYCLENWGNASSREHRYGWNARDAVEEARYLVSELTGSPSNTIFFTSGATEGINYALRGFVGFRDWHKKKIVTCAAEHSAVLTTSQILQRLTSVELEVIPVDSYGICCLEGLQKSLNTDKHCLVAIMSANNELGTVQNTDSIYEISKNGGAIFLCDTSQSFGKSSPTIQDFDADIFVVSSHKMYGPKGIGAVVIKDSVTLEPLITGGGQEGGVRGGTLNSPGIVGFGVACRIAKEDWESDNHRITKMRDRFEATLLASLSDIWINGLGAPRLSNTSNIGFHGIDAKNLIRDMHDIACSTKSACSSGDSGPSHVLKALGLTDKDAYSCVRFSLGRFTTDAEIDYALKKITHSVQKLRQII